MIRYFYSLLLFSVLFAQIGCIRDSPDINLLPTDKKIAVYCILDPRDELVTAYVYNTKPFFGEPPANAFEPVSNARVYLYDTEKYIQLKLVGNVFQCSQRDFPIIAGKKYFLRVYKGDETKYLYATCVVPAENGYTISIQVINDTLIKEIIDDIGSYEWNYRSTVKVIPSLKNLYNLITYAQGTFVEYKDFKEQRYQQYSSYNIRDFRRVFYSDFVTFNESTGDFTCTTLVKGDYGRRYIIKNIEVASINYVLTIFDSNFWNYTMSIQTNKDPFAEPNIIFSNIDGGVGIFGAKISISKPSNFDSKMIDNK